MSPRDITKPGVFRLFLDRCVPSLHGFLTRVGTFSSPPERDDLNAYLRTLSAGIEQDIQHKTYIPVAGKEVPSTTLYNEGGPDPFVAPIHQVIRHIMGQAEGGDSVSAQLAAVNRRSRMVRNILKTLVKARDPLMLLGDPGTGKTMTLQQATLALAKAETKRVFPAIMLYIRLGEFFVEGDARPEDVWAYVMAEAPDGIRPYLHSLDRAEGRLILFFDGMDEMSRDRYNEHTEALSVFAGARRGLTKTLFSCRITDFSPKFIHQRLVILPFDRHQIVEYLRKYIPAFPIHIEGKQWTLRQLARRLASEEMPVETGNPFVLWLLCHQLQNRGVWPATRVELLQYYVEENYRRKANALADDEEPFPDAREMLLIWGYFAYEITVRNQGTAIPVRLLKAGPYQEEVLQNAIRAGARCGLLAERSDGTEQLIRFEHHRFQEYFTAYDIYQRKPEISWLDKLDAPRWQETMLNLLLMGGSTETAQTLADAITEPIATLEQAIAIMQKPLEEGSEFSEEDYGFLEEFLDSATIARMRNEIQWMKKRFEEARMNEGADSKLEEWMREQWLHFLTDQRSKLRLEEHVETLLADRVELGSRILRQAAGTEAARDILSAPLQRAVPLLARHGNPITQVKIIRASQNTPHLEAVNVVQDLLNSPIDWVRRQAVIALANTKRLARKDGPDLPTVIGYDLANGLFIRRLPGYVAAIAKGRNRRNWLSLLAALGCFFLYTVLLLVIPVIGFDYFFNLLELDGQLGGLSQETIQRAYFGFLGGAVLVGIFWKPELLWVLILGTAVALPVLAKIFIVAWTGSLDEAVTAIFYALGGAINLYLWGGFIGLAAQSVALGVYLSITYRVREGDRSLKPHFEGMIRNCGYEMSIDMMRQIGPFLLVFGLSVFIAQYIADFIPLPFSSVTNKLILTGVLIVLVMFLIAPYRSWFLGLVKAVLKAVREDFWKSLMMTGGVLAYLGFMVAVIYFVPKAWQWLLEHLSDKTAALIAKIVAAVLFLALLGVMVFLFAKLFRLLRAWMLRLRQPYPPGKFTPDQWKAMMDAADPYAQRTILTRTNHQSVSLNPADFLALLREVESAIHAEPALSMYWDQRDKLEDVLRQERRG